jgi:hypothetical protein
LDTRYRHGLMRSITTVRPPNSSCPKLHPNAPAGSAEIPIAAQNLSPKQKVRLT